MKLTTFLLIITTLQIFASGVYSQKTDLTIHLGETTVGEVLNEIESQSEFYFLFNQKLVDIERKVEVQVNRKKIDEVLDMVFTDTNTDYFVMDRQIVLSPSEYLVELKTPLQPRTVTGRVTGENGEPMEGVTVMVRGTTIGTITDSEGVYEIEIPSDAEALVYSFVGMLSQEIPIDNRNEINIQMQSDVFGVDEVTVVGYGTKRKVDLTGAISAVDGEEIRNRPSSTVSQSLNGKIPGVYFETGTAGYQPGSELAIQIRGQGTPLILIDGVPGSLDRLNPNDIESFSVLKDAASSAIYGARAAYGVVLITTKSGTKTDKVNIEYSHSNSVTELIRLPKMLDSYTNAKALNEACVNSGQGLLFPESYIDRIIAYQNDPTLPETVPSASNPLVWAVNNESNANHDWIDVYYGRGNRNQDNISIYGGSQKLSYFLSGGYQHEKGELKVADDLYKRYNAIAKFDMNPLDWLNFSSNTRYANTDRDRPSCRPRGGYDALFWNVIRNYPTQYITDPNGHTSRISWIPFVRDGGRENISINDFIQRFTAKITPLEGLAIQADYSFEITNTLNNYVSKTTYDYNVNNQPIVMSQTVPNYVRVTQTDYFYNTMNAYVTYDLNVAEKHHATFLAGYQLEKSNQDYLFGYKTDLIVQDLPTLNLATGVPQTSSNVSRYATQGIFARINYDFDKKYLFEANARYDGTYKFAPGKKWGFFPSVSAGWVISQEDFWEQIRPVINLMKIRASYGVLGNHLTAAAYQDLALMDVNTNLNWIINGTRPAYVSAPSLINPDVTWESSATQDLGIDLGLFQNKLTFTGDIYKRYTYNQLGPSEALPSTIGVSRLPLSNNMETTTTGWEFSLGWKGQIGNEVYYSLNGMMFDHLTKVTSYNNPTKILTNPYAGQTVGEIWGFETVGLIQTQERADYINENNTQQAISGLMYNTGDCEYRDLDGDGVITYGSNTVDDPGDRRIIGNSTPRYQFGLNFRAEWKGLDLSFFMQGTLKRDLMLSYNMMWGAISLYNNQFTEATLDYYRDTEATYTTGLGMNLDAYYPRPYNSMNMNNKNQITQTRYLQNAAYARLKHVQIGYTLPNRWLQTIRLEDLYIYVSGENLLTFTNLQENFDPETGNKGVHWWNWDLSGHSFPPSAMVTVGINVKF